MDVNQMIVFISEQIETIETEGFPESLNDWNSDDIARREKLWSLKNHRQRLIDMRDNPEEYREDIE